MQIPRVGELITVTPSVGELEKGTYLVKRPQEGRVIFVHPEHRFFTVRFPSGSCESFLMRKKSNKGRK